MKKVFIVHGFQGSPNGGWRPWLMSELEKQGIYACALAMSNPESPDVSSWIKEIARHVENSNGDDIYLVGHSLGTPAILRYLDSEGAKPVVGAVLVSGPAWNNGNPKISGFLDEKFDYEKIRKNCKLFAVIHGDTDSVVPVEHAVELAKNLRVEPIIIKNGGHLNGSSGWLSLLPCLDALSLMFAKE